MTFVPSRKAIRYSFGGAFSRAPRGRGKDC